MARTGLFHHVGTFLLFAATILFLITTISSPVVNKLPLMKVELTNGTSTQHSNVVFGTFGYCITHTQQGSESCTKKVIGYNPAQLMDTIDNTSFDRAAKDTTKALTRVMVLHPVVCALSFVAFLFALGAGVCGALFASLLAALTFIIGVVVVACDFVLFAIIKRHVNKDGSGSKAKYDVGLWTALAALVCLFLGTIIVFFTCCSSRMHKNRDSSRVVKEDGYAPPVTTKRHFWQRRTNY